MPTKSKLVYLPPAQHDFEEIVKYHITEAGTPYARKIYSTMKTTINRLRDFPLMGQTHPDPILAASGYRKLVLTKTYVAIYKLIGDTVYVYAIVNGTTDYPRLLKRCSQMQNKILYTKGCRPSGRRLSASPEVNGTKTNQQAAA